MFLRRFQKSWMSFRTISSRFALPGRKHRSPLDRELRLQSARPPLLKELRSRTRHDGENSDLRPKVELETVGPMTTMINVPEIAKCRLHEILRHAG